MQGRRQPDFVNDYGPPDDWQQGDYGKDEKGDWWVWPPECNPCHITGNGEAANWKVTENEDKTITVSPSIFYNPPNGWHGHLVNGEWKKC